jgi:predicted ATPase
VGREHELELLDRGLDEARSRLCVVDLVAEPGFGKSRLLHEFRRRIGKDGVFILTGSCSPDSQQTPFLPFIEGIPQLTRTTQSGQSRPRDPPLTLAFLRNKQFLSAPRCPFGVR